MSFGKMMPLNVTDALTLICQDSQNVREQKNITIDSNVSHS